MKDCSQNLGPRLRHLSNRITQYMDQQFLALDLTSTQSFTCIIWCCTRASRSTPRILKSVFI